MDSMQQRRQYWLERLRSDSERPKVVAYLKTLMGIPPNEPLPDGTPIITEIIRREDARQEREMAAAAEG